MSRRKVVSAAFTGVAATGGALFLAAGPAHATASTWNVSKGGPVTTKNSTGQDVFKDTTANQTITCPVNHVRDAGSIPNGISRPGKSLGTVTKFSPGFSGNTNPCSGPLGLKFNGNLIGAPWHINAKSQTGSVTTGSITGIHEHAFTVAGIVSCKFSVSGPVKGGASGGTAFGTYTNATGVLTVKSAALTVHNVTGCGGLIKSGDKATFTGPDTVFNSTNGHPVLHHNTT